MDSSPRSYLVNSGQRNNCSHWIKVWHRTYPICDASFSGSAQHSFAPLQESRRVWTEALSYRIFVPAQNLPGIVNIAKGQRCAHVPTPLLSNTAPFYGYLKLLKLHYRKERSRKKELEVTRRNRPKERPRTNPSSLLKVHPMSTHLGCSFFARCCIWEHPKRYIGHIRYLK